MLTQTLDVGFRSLWVSTWQPRRNFHAGRRAYKLFLGLNDAAITTILRCHARQLCGSLSWSVAGDLLTFEVEPIYSRRCRGVWMAVIDSGCREASMLHQRYWPPSLVSLWSVSHVLSSLPWVRSA